jgi:hypothetical protein
MKSGVWDTLLHSLAFNDFASSAINNPRSLQERLGQTDQVITFGFVQEVMVPGADK